MLQFKTSKNSICYKIKDKQGIYSSFSKVINLVNPQFHSNGAGKTSFEGLQQSCYLSKLFLPQLPMILKDKRQLIVLPKYGVKLPIIYFKGTSSGEQKY